VGLKKIGPKGKGYIELTLATGKQSGYRFALAPGKVAAHGVTEIYVISARRSADSACS